MTDTQERVVVNQNTNGLRFEFLRRLENSFITSERFIYGTIAAVVVVVAVFYHKHAINSHEARFETTVIAINSHEARFETLVKAINSHEARFETTVKAINSHEARFETTVKAIQKLEEKMVKEFNVLRGLLVVDKNCAEVYKSGGITSGVYRIKPDGAGPDFEVFCDQETTGGGWTVVQKRLDGSVLFDRGWSDYKNGFGNLDGEFWLGLEKIHRLTKSPSKLRVDLEDFYGKTSYAEYDFVFAHRKCPTKNAGNGISKTLCLKLSERARPLTPVIWSTFAVQYFLLVHTPSESHATPLAIKKRFLKKF